MRQALSRPVADEWCFNRHCEHSDRRLAASEHRLHEAIQLFFKSPDCFVAYVPRNDENKASSKIKRALGTSATQRPQRPSASKGMTVSDADSRGFGVTPQLKLRRTQVAEAQSSAGSSPSASRSGVPAKICSAISPEFCRIATSILAVMSGLARRKALAFSRPCPSRWLS